MITGSLLTAQMSPSQTKNQTTLRLPRRTTGGVEMPTAECGPSCPLNSLDYNGLLSNLRLFNEFPSLVSCEFTGMLVATIYGSLQMLP